MGPWPPCSPTSRWGRCSSWPPDLKNGDDACLTLARRMGCRVSHALSGGPPSSTYPTKRETTPGSPCPVLTRELGATPAFIVSSGFPLAFPGTLLLTARSTHRVGEPRWHRISPPVLRGASAPQTLRPFPSGPFMGEMWKAMGNGFSILGD